MKILMLVPFLPNTKMSGGQTRWYNIIKYLSKNHEITLFSLIKDEAEKRFIPQLSRYCKKVLVFRRPKSPWTLRNLFLTAVGFFPLLVIRNWSFTERRAIKEELSKEKYDLIHAETFYVMPHLAKTNIPTLLVEQTIEYLVYKHYVDREVAPLFRPVFMLDVLKLRFWEKFYWRKATQLVAVSSEDKKIMEKEIPGISVEIIPNGIDAAHFAQRRVDRKVPARVLFVGNFKWLQNIEAADILVSEVWPGVRKQAPFARLWIVGISIPQRFHELAQKREDIEVTESIPDIRDAYQAASVMVVPLQGPGGTRLKVLEAMASGLPVVSTSIGVAGLNVAHGRETLVSDAPDGLVKFAVDILKDEDLAGKIGERGRKYVAENYDWKSIVKLHDKIYENALKFKNGQA